MPKKKDTLKKFHAQLERNGIKSKLRRASDRHTFDHIHITSVKIKTSIDATVADNNQIELSIPYRRYTAAPDAAIGIILELAKKGSA